MKNELTPWFSTNKKPHRAGVYETKIRFYPGSAANRYQHWNGSRWGAFADSVRAAKENMRFASAHQNVKWRGLAKKP